MCGRGAHSGGVGARGSRMEGIDLPTNIDELQIEIEATSSDAAAKIDQLAASLSNLRSVARGGAGLTTVTRQLRELSSVAGSASNASSNISRLVSALNGLRGIQKNTAVNSTINALRRLQSTDLSGIQTERIQSIATALNTLGNVQRSNGLNSTINALRRLPEISQSLESMNLDTFATQMQRVSAAIAPLATQMQSVANGFAAFPARIQTLIRNNDRLASSNQRVSNSYGVLGTGISRAQLRFGAMLVITRQLASVMSNWVKESNDYVENLNLFAVAMGEYAEEAQAYAEEVQAAMGIDASDWMRNQGVFMQMASGFGVVAEDAALMSQNLTQLGYDISSFYNISIEDAMQKLQSGLAGEIEPLRRLGYAIDEASLSQVALNHGITQSVSSMTQAEKSQLRYIAIMEQSTNAMGDMARTIQTPANAMRILDQQITQLSRALGNMLIPILQQIIPWVQAFVVVLTEAAQAIALLFGFELPTIDYSGLDGVSAGASDVEDSLEGATGAAKDLQKELLGIDELNIIEPNNASGGGSGAGISGSGLDLDLPSYDFLDGLEERTSQITDFLRGIADEVAAIGAGFAAWKIASSVLGWFNDLKNGRFNKIDKLAAGIGLIVTGFTLEFQGAYDLGYNGPTLENVLKTVIGAGLGIAGSLLVFGTGPLGWTIGILAALTIGITGFVLGYNQRQLENELAERFGEIVLTVEEAKEVAEKMMTSPLTIQLDAFVEAQVNADSAIQAFIESAEELNNLVWRVSVGLDVDENALAESIDTMISDAQTYLDAQQEMYTLAISIGLSDQNIQSDLLLFIDELFAGSNETVIEKSEELKQTLWNALSDGVIGPEEQSAINNIIQEMYQVMDKVSDAEYQIEISALSYRLEDDVSYDSLMAVLDEADAIAQQRIDELADTRAATEYALKLKYEDDGNLEEFVDGMNDAMRTYFANTAQIQSDAFQPIMDKVSQAFSDAISESQGIFDEPMEELMKNFYAQWGISENERMIDSSISEFVSAIQNTWSYEIARIDMDTGTRLAVEEALEAMRPEAQHMAELAEEIRQAGLTVPESLIEGITDYNMLNALTGDLDSINYLIGQKFSTDPSFIEALQYAEDGAAQLVGTIADGFLDHTEIKQNVDGTISFINDEIGNLVVEYTPQLQALFEALGVNLTDSLEDTAVPGAQSAMDSLGSAITREANGLKTSAYNAGSSIGSNLSAGVAAGVNGALAGVRAAASNVVNTAKRTMQSIAVVKSPSRLFRDEVGRYIGLGVAEGIDDASSSVDAASTSLIESSLSNMRLVTESIAGAIRDVNDTISGEQYTIASEQVASVSIGNIGDIFRRAEDYQNRDAYDPNDANGQIVSTILAAAQQITSAVEESGGDVYMDGDKVGERVTAWQNRQNRIYGRPVQRI